MDETGVNHFTPETKQQSKKWVEAGVAAPKKGKSATVLISLEIVKQ